MPPLARQPLSERHKAVRRSLKLEDGGSEFQAVWSIVVRLVQFRDSFAHPKVHQERMDDVVRSELDKLPNIAWESELDAKLIESDYQRLEAYSEGLLNTAAGLLEKAYEDGWTAWQQDYPHLTNLMLEAAYLRALLFNTAYASVDYQP